MATPNVGAFQGRGVVHAIAGHGHKLAARLQGLDDTNFLRRVYPGIHPHMLRTRDQRFFVQRGQFNTRDNRCLVVDNNAQPDGNRPRRGWVVTGDHHRGNAGVHTLAHGSSSLGPRRIHQAHQSDKRKAAFQRQGIVTGRWQLGVVAPCQRQHPQSLRRQRLGTRQPDGAFQRHSGAIAVVRLPAGHALGQHGLGRALGVGHQAVGRAVESGHALAAGIKG
jgi:hypothetical protein